MRIYIPLRETLIKIVTLPAKRGTFIQTQLVWTGKAIRNTTVHERWQNGFAGITYAAFATFRVAFHTPSYQQNWTKVTT